MSYNQLGCLRPYALMCTDIKKRTTVNEDWEYRELTVTIDIHNLWVPIDNLKKLIRAVLAIEDEVY